MTTKVDGMEFERVPVLEIETGDVVLEPFLTHNRWAVTVSYCDAYREDGKTWVQVAYKANDLTDYFVLPESGRVYRKVQGSPPSRREQLIEYLHEERINDGGASAHSEAD